MSCWRTSQQNRSTDCKHPARTQPHADSWLRHLVGLMTACRSRSPTQTTHWLNATAAVLTPSEEKITDRSCCTHEIAIERRAVLKE